MTDERVESSFAGLLRLAVSSDHRAGASIDSRHFERTKVGARMLLPMGEKAAISVTVVGGRVAPPESLIDWLAGDGAGPIMSRLRVVEVEASRGKFGAGTALPATSMQSEFETQTGFPKDPTFGDFEYNLDSTIEVKTEVSHQVIVQSNDDLVNAVLEAHALAVSDKLLEQVLSGDNVDDNLNGIINATGIGAVEYPVADRGEDSAFLAGESAVEDAGGRGPYLAWAAGTSLSTSARNAVIEPGGSRRVEEGGRLVLSGLPVQRVSADALAVTTGLLADWRSIVVPIASEIELTIDRVTQPGILRLTSRLPVSNPVVTIPGLVYVLTQAP